MCCGEGVPVPRPVAAAGWVDSCRQDGPRGLWEALWLLTSEWSRFGESALPGRCRGFPRYQSAAGAPSSGGRTARTALTGLCWGTVRWRQRFRWEDLAQRSVQTFVSAEPSRAERPLQHSHAAPPRPNPQIFVSKKKQNPSRGDQLWPLHSAALRESLWNGAQPRSSHRLLQTIKCHLDS